MREDVRLIWGLSYRFQRVVARKQQTGRGIFPEIIWNKFFIRSD